MDLSPFLDSEDNGTLVFRPYSKSAATWETDSSDILVDAWGNPDNMEANLKATAANMNEVLAEE